MYDNLRDLSLRDPVTVTLPAAAWLAIATWYGTIHVNCPEMNWLNREIAKAMLTPLAFKESEAEIADQNTVEGQLRRIGAPEEVIAEITRQIDPANPLIRTCENCLSPHEGIHAIDCPHNPRFQP